MLIEVVNMIGASTLAMCTMFGQFTLFFWDFLQTLFTTRLKVKKVFAQMELIGVGSLIIIVITGTFAGAVLTLQSYIGLKRYGGEEFIGPLVAFSMARELGPVFTGLMVAGRAGSAITAEIGTMRITEQIDALKTLCINPQQYLVVPRILAGTIIMPMLTVFTMICGIAGGYFIGVTALGLNGQQYISGIQRYVELQDIIKGLIKAGVFGVLLTWVGSFKGYYADGGAQGVGIATTQSVVMASILIIAANYFLTAAMF